ncbi:MAG TPA: hypothetical protein VKG45_13915 [Actinomycetes bacterium]|nr:hypothetical protein [Actinomycetes bacterium]
MPSLDMARGRARLSYDHISVLGALLARRPIPSGQRAALTQLADSGLLGPHGDPVPTLEPIMRVLADATVILDVQTIGIGGIVGHGAWATATEAVAADGWPGERECEYIPMELSVLPWAIARTTGLHRPGVDRPRPVPPRLQVPARLFDGAISAVADLPPAWARRVPAEAVADAVGGVLARAGPLPEAGRGPLTRILLGVRVFWRVVATEAAPEGSRVAGSLAVLDAGPAGSWRHEQPAAGAGGEVLLTRRSPDELWSELVELLPAAAVPGRPPDDGP